MISSIAKERISEVIRVDTVTSSQADFLATHVPIKKINIRKKWDGKTENTHTEEEVYNRFVLNPGDKHQFIIVIGSSGAGKSHLIRWFAAKLDRSAPENEVVLFVRRSDNSLKGTIKQLLELPEVANIPNKEVYDRLVRATATIDDRKLRDMIYQNFIVEIKSDENDEILSNNEKKKLIALLQNDLFQSRMMKEEGAIDRIYQKVAESNSGDNRDVMPTFDSDDFELDVDFCDDLIRDGADKRALKMADTILADDEMPERLADYMNTLVNKVIQLCAGLEPGDFEQVFIEIRKEIKRQGKQLTLLIEDITAFTGVNVALLNVLTTEHTGMYEEQGLCRISSIIGTTEKYFNVNFLDNHKDRVTQFFNIPNDVFGEDKNALFEFVGRYLNTMSLKTVAVDSWAKNGASDKEYPVHASTEGKSWDTVSIAFGKELSLFPFTKNAITNLYTCILRPDYRTPRYLLRDVIERVIRNYLYNPTQFPDFQIDRVDLIPLWNPYNHPDYVKQKIGDGSFDRVARFIRIWGDANAYEYIDPETNVKYLGGLPIEYYNDLGIPSFDGIKERAKPVGKSQPVKGEVKEEKGTSESGTVDVTPPEPPKLDPAMVDFQMGIQTLDTWVAGGSLNVGATTKDVVMITKARDELNKFILSAINWQAEGVSLDNLNKVKATKDFIGFERQKRGIKKALVQLPANHETQSVMQAFVGYVTIGNNSWNFDNSAMMVYNAHLWIDKWKKAIVEAVNDFEGKDIDYFEYAIAAEMIRQIIFGVYEGKTISGMSASSLIAKNIKQMPNNAHCKEWNQLASMIAGSDAKVKDVIIQYFNIVQGNLKSTQVFLRYTEYIAAVKKVQKQNALFDDDSINEVDPIPQRREIRDVMQKIQPRLAVVCEKEKEKASQLLERLEKYLDIEDVNGDDIKDLITQIKLFYKTANDSLVNIYSDTSVINGINKDAAAIGNAICDVAEAVEVEDPLECLMRFSQDPLSKLTRLLELLDKVQKDLDYANNDVTKRKAKITVSETGDGDRRYSAEQKAISSAKTTVDRWEVE